MRDRYPLSSEQLELLLAFEQADGSLGRLAETVRRDASVVSRNLQRLAEDAPVLEKRGGKWRLTDAGRRTNELSRSFLGALSGVLAPVSDASRALLVVINAQRALRDPARGPRSNPGAEANAAQLLAGWRALGRPLVHVKHASLNPESPFHPAKESSAFLPALAPLSSEWVVEKPGTSAFTAPRFGAELAARGVDTLVLAGFTANECVDATAKQARDLGFVVWIAADATAMFDLVGPDGSIYPSEKTQEMLFASLHAGGARIVTTAALLKEIQ